MDFQEFVSYYEDVLSNLYLEHDENSNDDLYSRLMIIQFNAVSEAIKHGPSLRIGDNQLFTLTDIMGMNPTIRHYRALQIGHELSSADLAVIDDKPKLCIHADLWNIYPNCVILAMVASINSIGTTGVYDGVVFDLPEIEGTTQEDRNSFIQSANIINEIFSGKF